MSEDRPDKTDVNLNLLDCPPGALFHSLASCTLDGLLAVNPDGQIVAANPTVEQLLGRRMEGILGQNISVLLSPKSFQALRMALTHCMESGLSGPPRRLDNCEAIGGDGSFIPADLSISSVRNNGRWIFFVAIRDLSEVSQVRALLEKQAISDPLTGLFSRHYFEQRGQEQIAWADRKRTTMAIVLCDLDRFKEVNEMNPRFGDEVLKLVAQSIRRAMRQNDLAFRWGGDETILILPETDRRGAMVVCERIRATLREFVGKETGIYQDVSIGVALYPTHGRDLRELTQVASRALHISKKGGDRIHIGEEDYLLDASAVQLVFQPIVTLGSNAVMGYEALSRDPKNRASVYDLFKRYEMIGRLDDLKRLCFHLQLQAAERYGLKRLFMNVDFDMLSHVELVPKPKGMDVILEISELEDLRDIQNHLFTARPWQEEGYQFAIDDFGSGFVSLPFIAQFHPDYIKVDRSTISLATHSEQFKGFTRKLLMALEEYVAEGIIGEGIETDEEREVALDLGMGFGQGYLFGRPQALSQIGSA